MRGPVERTNKSQLEVLGFVVVESELDFILFLFLFLSVVYRWYVLSFVVCHDS